MNPIKAIANFFTSRRANLAPRSEPLNVSSSADVARVQSYIRQAEAGNTQQLFALYRDLTISGSHVQCEFSKRKLALIGQPLAVMPADKKNAEDVKAAEAVKWMIETCENWDDGITHLLDSSLWPVASVEKIFMGTGSVSAAPSPSPLNGDNARGAMSNPLGLQFALRRIEPVNHTLLCFQRPWGEIIDPNEWEGQLRFYETQPDGTIIRDYSKAYRPDPIRHIVHRGHLLVSIPDCWGGPMRAIVFWDLLAKLGRDWFGRGMERYGSPYAVGHVDSANKEAVTFLQEAFSLSTKVGGLVVDHDTQVELIQAAQNDLADAHEKFIAVCHREISKVILGQTLSAEAQPTGLGSGTSNLQSDVRDDFRQFDQQKLAGTLKRQLFAQFLQINGLKGAPPTIVWGGLDSEDAECLGALLVQLSQAQLEPTDEAIPTLSERIGFDLQRKELPEPTGVVPFSARNVPGVAPGTARGARALPPGDLVASLAQSRRATLAAAFRGELKAVPLLLERSTSPEEFIAQLSAYFSTWTPEKVYAVGEEALQLAAAAGAGSIRGAHAPSRVTFDAPVERPPITLNIELKPEAKKSIRLTRDFAGNITGAERE